MRAISHTLLAIALAVGSVVVLGAVPVLRTAAERASDPGPTLAPGVLLVASPRLRDPTFRGAVILVASWDRSGATGLVVDAPPASAGPSAAGWGGPLRPGQVTWVVPAVTPLARCIALPGGLTLTPDGAGAGVSGSRPFRGVAGWWPGELRREIARGVWVVVPGGRRRVLTADPAGLWPRLAGSVLRRFRVR